MTFDMLIWEIKQTKTNSTLTYVEYTGHSCRALKFKLFSSRCILADEYVVTNACSVSQHAFPYNWTVINVSLILIRYILMLLCKRMDFKPSLCIVYLTVDPYQLSDYKRLFCLWICYQVYRFPVYKTVSFKRVISYYIKMHSDTQFKTVFISK